MILHTHKIPLDYLSKSGSWVAEIESNYWLDDSNIMAYGHTEEEAKNEVLSLLARICDDAYQLLKEHKYECTEGQHNQ